MVMMARAPRCPPASVVRAHQARTASSASAARRSVHTAKRNSVSAKIYLRFVAIIINCVPTEVCPARF